MKDKQIEVFLLAMIHLAYFQCRKDSQSTVHDSVAFKLLISGQFSWGYFCAWRTQHKSFIHKYITLIVMCNKTHTVYTPA